MWPEYRRRRCDLAPTLSSPVGSFEGKSRNAFAKSSASENDLLSRLQTNDPSVTVPRLATCSAMSVSQATVRSVVVAEKV
jgi:hypothetical protein